MQVCIEQVVSLMVQYTCLLVHTISKFVWLFQFFYNPHPRLDYTLNLLVFLVICASFPNLHGAADHHNVCTYASKHRHTDAQMHRGTDAQMHRCTDAEVHGNSVLCEATPTRPLFEA